LSRYGNEFESLYKVLGSDEPQQLRADNYRNADRFTSKLRLELLIDKQLHLQIL
jgi:hypothetical protein